MNVTGTFCYFAYGSNLKLSEIHRSCPTAERRCRAVLQDYSLVFPRESVGRKCGVASFERRPGGEVWGGVYAISESERGSLESREGFKQGRSLSANSYVPANVTVFENGDLARPLEVMTFVANLQPNPPLPSNDYKDLIIAGAHEWNLDAGYIARLEQIETSKS